MAKRESIKTKIEEIVDYWSGRIDESTLSVDWAEARERCWRCGCERKLERCHIIPHSLGGEDEPSNFVLLCKRCHAEAPNLASENVMWDWLQVYKVSFYDTFWGVTARKEYEFIYGNNYFDDITSIMKSVGIEKCDDFNDIFHPIMDKVFKKQTSWHFRQYYLNTSTYAGALRMALVELADTLGVEFPTRRQEKTETPWWLHY